MEVPETLSPIHEGFERLPVKGAESGEWDVPAGIVPAHDAARAVAALRLHSKLGLKRRSAIVNINNLIKLNEEWPADLPAPSGSLEDLFVYAMEIAQPAEETGQLAGPVARVQSLEQLGFPTGTQASPTAAAHFREQLDPGAGTQASPIKAPSNRRVKFHSPELKLTNRHVGICSSNQTSLWVPQGNNALIWVVRRFHSV